MTVVELGSMEPDELAAAIEAAKDGWPDQWYCLPVVVEAYRTALQRELEAADSRPPLSASGRGIVICAGGPLYLTCAWVCVRRLRQLGCELPIQIWHRGPDELPEPFRRAFDTSDVEFIDALEIHKCVPMRILNGWELKAFALLCTPFAQVLQRLRRSTGAPDAP